MSKEQENQILNPPSSATYEELDEYYTNYDTENLLNAGILRKATQEEYQELKQNLGKKPRKAQINFRLNEDELNLLKKIAKFKAIPYGVLARSWVIERLRAELKLFEES